MLDRQHGHIVFECDTCDEVLETDEDEFNAAKAEFDRAGWAARKYNGDWCHFCPTCKPKARSPHEVD